MFIVSGFPSVAASLISQLPAVFIEDRRGPGIVPWTPGRTLGRHAVLRSGWICSGLPCFFLSHAELLHERTVGAVEDFIFLKFLGFLVTFSSCGSKASKAQSTFVMQLEVERPAPLLTSCVTLGKSVSSFAN